ncbi:MAG: FG-GAP repeat domain-containing protein, partial [Armatimonadota bacterium]
MNAAWLVVAAAGSAAVGANDWPVFRHDPQLTGRSRLTGDITRPEIVGEHFVGAYDGWFIATPAANQRVVVAAEPREGDVEAVRRRFGLGPPLYDLRGDGNLVALAQSTGRQVGKILPGAAGLQAIEFDDAFGYRGGDRGHLFSYEPGSDARSQVWETPPEPNMFMPLVLLLDADGDDDPEAVVATHYRVMVFDARTGHKDAELRIHNYRNYGFFGAEDLDGDGRPEFVIIADFSSHVDVVDYEGGELRLLWRRDIDPDLTVREKSVRVGPDPIVDVDGDGRWELVFNLFNDEGDGQWHVVAYDALNGRLKWDLARRFLAGWTRLDEGPGPCLLTTDTDGLPLPRWGTLRLLRISQTGVHELWRASRAQWQTWEVPVLPPTRNTGATLGRETALVDENAGLLYLRRPGHGDDAIVCAMEWNDGAPREVWRAMGPGLRALASRDLDGDGHPEVLLRIRSHKQRAQVRGSGVSPSLQTMLIAPTRPTSPVAADLDGDGRPEIVVNDEAGGMVALKTSISNIGATWDIVPLWRVRGRAMGDSQVYWYGAQIADVDGDGEPEVVIGGGNDEGQAELRVLDRAGRIEWTRRFPRIDGSEPVWNRGCLTYWAVVERADGPAIYASVRRNLMHSDESMLLRGSDGDLLWRCEKVRCPHAKRAPGGKMVAAADVNDDGTDDIVITYPDVLVILDGRDGELLVCHPTVGDDMPGWTAYAVPIV